MKDEEFSILHNGINFNISAKTRTEGENFLFFIHGLGCTKETFENAWPSQHLRNYSIITFDLPGFGNSSKPANFSYSLEEQAEICSQIFKKYPGKKIHIIAHSMGGAIGLFLCKNSIQLPSSFINIEGNLYSGDCHVSRKAISVPFDAYNSRISNLIRLSSNRLEEPGIRHWLSCIERSDPAAFNRSSASLVNRSDSGILLQIFKELNCPKVYFYGERNKRMNTLSYINDIPKVSIRGSGHFPMIDNPDEFYFQIDKFITSQKN